MVTRNVGILPFGRRGARNSAGQHPVVTDDLPGEEHIFFLRAGSNVVNHQRPSVFETIAHDADVIEWDFHGHDVTGPVLLRIGAHRERVAPTREVRRDVSHSSVVDIRVSLL